MKRESDYSASPQFNARTGSFHHPNHVYRKKSKKNVWRLIKAYRTRQKDPAEKRGFPTQFHDAGSLQRLKEEVLWVGHASVLLQTGGKIFLFDPVFSERASPVQWWGPRRVSSLPFNPEALPVIDVVLISHSHYDHLDQRSIRFLVQRNPNTRFFVPLGLASLLRKWGAQRVQECDWWQEIHCGSFHCIATPARHWTSRSLWDRNKSLWCSWMVRWPDFTFFFAGDSGYSRDFCKIREALGPCDLAAIPIGAYEPRDFMRTSHVNPEEAIKIFHDLGARRAFAIHWGTFKLTTEPLDEPCERLKRACHNHSVRDFVILPHGATLPTARRNSGKAET